MNTTLDPTPPDAPETEATWGLLLMNLGTPDSPKLGDVRKYLREFLSDPRVIDIPGAVRWPLVNMIIAPFRAPKSGKAYSKVWTERGSPLLWHTQDLTEKVRAALGPSVQVEFAMRYQSPSTDSALQKFREKGVDRIMVFPLYPHYASSTSGSVFQEVMDQIRERWNVPELVTVGPYYAHPAYVRAWETIARPILDEFKPDRVLFSYHGVPVRHVKKSDEVGGHCGNLPECCKTLTFANRNCYSAQCYATTKAVTRALGIPDDMWEQSYQSRLGRDPWLEPFTDDRVETMAHEEGVKRLAVFCPAFTSDCLETIEEIGMEAEEEFLEAGGEAFQMIPSLNSTDGWVEAIRSIALEHRPEAWASSPMWKVQ